MTTKAIGVRPEGWELMAMERAALEPRFAILLRDFEEDLAHLVDDSNDWNLRAAAMRDTAPSTSLAHALGLAPVASPETAGPLYRQLLEYVTACRWYFPVRD